MNSEGSFRDQVQALRLQLVYFAQSLTKNRSYAEDLAQETVLRALEHEQQFQVGSNLKAWLFVILRNQYYGELRKSWRMESRELLDFQWLSDRGAQAERGDARLMLAQVGVVIASMSSLRRDAFNLIMVHGCSYEEAAEKLRVPVGTVKSAVFRVRIELSRRLKVPLVRRTSRKRRSQKPTSMHHPTA